MKWMQFVDSSFTYRLDKTVTPVQSYFYPFSVCSFIKAKSEVCLEDVGALVEIGLELFHKSYNKLYAQVLHYTLNISF